MQKTLEKKVNVQSVKMSAAVVLNSLTCLTVLTLSTWVLMRGAREEHDESVQTQISV